MQIAYHMFGEQLESVNGFFLHFLQALVKEAAADEYQIVVFTHQGTDPSPAFSELIARRNVDAFIVSESAVDDPRVRLLADNKIPFACLGRLAEDLPQQWVDVDNVAGMRSPGRLPRGQGPPQVRLHRCGGKRVLETRQLPDWCRDSRPTASHCPTTVGSPVMTQRSGPSPSG